MLSAFCIALHFLEQILCHICAKMYCDNNNFHCLFVWRFLDYTAPRFTKPILWFFENLSNSNKNRTNVIQIMLSVILAIAGKSELCCVIWPRLGTNLAQTKSGSESRNHSPCATPLLLSYLNHFLCHNTVNFYEVDAVGYSSRFYNPARYVKYLLRHC